MITVGQSVTVYRDILPVGSEGFPKGRVIRLNHYKGGYEYIVGINGNEFACDLKELVPPKKIIKNKCPKAISHFGIKTQF